MQASAVSAYLNKPWQANAEGPNAFCCTGLFRDLQGKLAGIAVPRDIVHIPEGVKHSLRAIKDHPHVKDWVPVEYRKPLGGVLMFRGETPIHIGTVLPDLSIIHADQGAGKVIINSHQQLLDMGYSQIQYRAYSPTG